MIQKCISSWNFNHLELLSLSKRETFLQRKTIQGELKKNKKYRFCCSPLAFPLISIKAGRYPSNEKRSMAKRDVSLMRSLYRDEGINEKKTIPDQPQNQSSDEWMNIWMDGWFNFLKRSIKDAGILVCVVVCHIRRQECLNQVLLCYKIDYMRARYSRIYCNGKESP